MVESLDPVLLADMDAYWRAANYLSVGRIYLLANPLLREPLKPEHVKPRVPGNWVATPGQSLIYVHLNRIIKEYDLNMTYIGGPGHGASALIVNAYLEGTYSELHPDVAQNEEGLGRLFRQFSFPHDIPSRVTPEPPGGSDEGGELCHPLGYAYSVACGSPDLLVACVVGDGETEAGPVAVELKGNGVVNPGTDGAVLPILHLIGYKNGNATNLARIGREHLRDFLDDDGYHPYFVLGDDAAKMHQLLARSLDEIVLEIGHIQSAARSKSLGRSLRWPLLVVCTPSGWTGPKTLDREPVEVAFRADQVPLPEARNNPAQLAMLEEWLRSYQPGELFDRCGRLHSGLADLAPKGGRRMGSTSRTIGGAPLRDFR